MMMYKCHDVYSSLVSQQMTITVLLTTAICISEEVTIACHLDTSSWNDDSNDDGDVGHSSIWDNEIDGYW